MFQLSESNLKILRAVYQKGTRVELDSMEDPWSTLKPGDRGTVVDVDDIGTVHVAWDQGSSLGLVFNEDKFHVIASEQEGEKCLIS